MIQAEAEKEDYDESAIMSGLSDLEAAREAGEFSEEEIEEAENALIERLVAIRGLTQEETDGSL